MGLRIFDRLFGRRREQEPRPREEWYDDQYYEGPPETENDSLIVDHHFIYPPEEDYEMRIGSMVYQIEIENNSDYPMGNIRMEFPKKHKLGTFGEPELSAKLLDPGEKLVVKVPFKPHYMGGTEELEFEILFFDFRYKVEERVLMKTDPLKVVVPKFEPLTMDEDRFRILTSDLYRWPFETDVLPISPDELYGTFMKRFQKIGFKQANEMLNENLFRGISQMVATDAKGRKWAAQVQVIGKGKESKVLLYTFGERPLYAYNLSVKTLLKIDRREDIMKGVV
ncbi:MAG: hypothetical protein ACMUHY_07335 [Thermoplasmatota archaeon]